MLCMYFTDRLVLRGNIVYHDCYVTNIDVSAFFGLTKSCLKNSGLRIDDMQDRCGVGHI